MAGSLLLSIFGVWNKLQEKVASTASSSRPLDLPRLKQLNDLVYEVHCPPLGEKAELEVVFFHGLQVRGCEDAHVTTWMTRDNSELWLQAWLVESFPKARIFTISYDSSAKKTPESGRLDMYCTAEDLVSSLTADDIRVGQAGCPVVLVGHCLGGLVLKELCVTAAWMVGRKSAERFGVQRVNDLFSNLRGMFFYGTPHTGSIGDELHNDVKGELLEEIKTMKASSARRHQEFDDLKSKFGWLTTGIEELNETYVECLGRYIHMVPEASTWPYVDDYYSAAADHYDICKPKGKNDSAFVHLKDFLMKIQNDGVRQAQQIAMAGLKSGHHYFVDLEGRAEQVWYILNRPDTSTIFIVGLSGIGKTSLARRVFHDISHTFSVALFVSLDTVDAPSESNCREQVLRKMQDALEGVNIDSNHDLSNVLSHLKGRRVLLVLDNLEFEDELKALHTETWLEGSASKLIITTTNARLGTPSNTFQVPYLSFTESQQLFCRYAFNAAQGPKDMRHLVSAVVRECDYFPLTLKVIGGFISNEDVHDKQLWLVLLDRLRNSQEIDSHPDYQHFAKLRICYEALSPPELEIYLDVATLFHGVPFDMVKCIWSAARESSRLAWRNLERRFLVEVDGFGRIWMQTLLRNLGQSVACPPNKRIEKWTRISKSSIAKELIANRQGVVNTLGLKLEAMEKESLTLRNTTFLNYIRLEYLMLEGVRTSPGTLALPKSLVYLRWTDGLFTCCPIDFTGLENLVALELVDCRSMTFLPPSVVKASKLIWMELGGCLALAELPLGLFRFLQYLGLNKTSLKNLPSDLGRHLLANETQLREIPQGLQRLENLSSPNLSETKLMSLFDSVGDLKRLENVFVSETMMTSLRLGALKHLTIQQGQNLKELAKSIGDLRASKYLTIQQCQNRKELLEAIEDLRALKYLTIQQCQNVKELVKTIEDLQALKDLTIQKSPSLELLPENIGRLGALKHDKEPAMMNEEYDTVAHKGIPVAETDARKFNVTDIDYESSSIVRTPHEHGRDGKQQNFVKDFIIEINRGESGYSVSKAWLVSLEEHDKETVMSVLLRAGYSEFHQSRTAVMYRRIEDDAQVPTVYNQLAACTTEKIDVSYDDTKHSLASNDYGGSDEIGEEGDSTKTQDGKELGSASQMERSDGLDSEMSTLSSSQKKIHLATVQTDETSRLGSPRSLSHKGNAVLAVSNEKLESFKTALKDTGAYGYAVSTEWLSTLSDHEVEDLKVVLWKARYLQIGKTNTTTYFKRHGNVHNNTGSQRQAPTTLERNALGDRGRASTSQCTESDLREELQDLSMKDTEVASKIQDKQRGHVDCECLLQDLIVTCRPSPVEASPSEEDSIHSTRQEVNDCHVTMPKSRTGLFMNTGADKIIEMRANDFAGMKPFVKTVSLHVKADSSLTCCVTSDQNNKKVRFEFRKIEGKVQVAESGQVEEPMDTEIIPLVLRALRTNVYAYTTRAERSEQVPLCILEPERFQSIDRKGQTTGLVLKETSSHPKNSESGSDTIELQYSDRVIDSDLFYGNHELRFNGNNGLRVRYEGAVPANLNQNSFLGLEVRYQLEICHFKCYDRPPREYPFVSHFIAKTPVDFNCILEFKCEIT